MRPVCATCCVSMRCAKNEHAVEVVYRDEPVGIFSGDRYECPNCPASIVIGFGEPFAAYLDGYEERAITAMRSGEYTRLGE